MQLVWSLSSMTMKILSSYWNNYFSCVVGLFVFSGAFSQPGFHFFPADQVDEHVERRGWDRGYKSHSSWSAHGQLEGFGECRLQVCRNSWVEVDSLAKPQNLQLSDCTPCFSDTVNDRFLHTRSFFWVWCWLVQEEGGNRVTEARGKAEWAGRGREESTQGLPHRVGLKCTGFSLYLVVSRFNCHRLLMKLLPIGISVSYMQVLIL